MAKKVDKAKKPRRRILCKVKNEFDDDWMIFYRDGTWRWGSSSYDDISLWKLAHSDLGPIFLYNLMEDDRSTWETDWNTDDESEARIANTIANALLDLEMENILKGKDEEAEPATTDKPSA